MKSCLVVLYVHRSVLFHKLLQTLFWKLLGKSGQISLCIGLVNKRVSEWVCVATVWWGFISFMHMDIGIILSHSTHRGGKTTYQRDVLRMQSKSSAKESQRSKTSLLSDYYFPHIFVVVVIVALLCYLILQPVHFHVLWRGWSWWLSFVYCCWYARWKARWARNGKRNFPLEFNEYL